MRTKPKSCPGLCSNRISNAKMYVNLHFQRNYIQFISAENYEFDICISSEHWSHIQSDPTHAERRLSKVSTQNELANQMLEHQMNKRNENPQPHPNRLARLLEFYYFVLFFTFCSM